MVSDALRESRSPHTVRQGINQRDARDQESSLRYHVLPPCSLVIDQCSLSINSRCFLAISCLQSYHSLKDDGRCEAGPRIMGAKCKTCGWGQSNVTRSALKDNWRTRMKWIGKPHFVSVLQSKTFCLYNIYWPWSWNTAMKIWNN